MASVLFCPELDRGRLDRLVESQGIDGWVPVPIAGGTLSFSPCRRASCRSRRRELEELRLGAQQNLWVMEALRPEKGALYLVDHQGCRAAALLGCVSSCPHGPPSPGLAKTEQREAHARLLLAAREAALASRLFSDVFLCMVDLAGAVGVYEDGAWRVALEAEERRPEALFDDADVVGAEVAARQAMPPSSWPNVRPRGRCGCVAPCRPCCETCFGWDGWG
jgi:hypothetical protein